MHDFENENVDIVIREEKEMSFRCIMMGSYNAEGAKGIIGGSDRMAAVKTVAEAAGGSVNFASFMRGRMDIIVDFNVPDAATAMGVMAAAHASGTFASLEVHECIDNGPVVAAAQRIMKAYVPANA
ncbi:GYD domain-containing protein [Planktomarina temperata]|nr:GYD domain-containing protein [Planktomarina temperata]